MKQSLYNPLLMYPSAAIDTDTSMEANGLASQMTSVQLQQILSSANIGLWSLNMHTGKMEGCKHFRLLFGINTAAEFFNIEVLYPQIDPLYLSSFVGCFQQGFIRKSISIEIQLQNPFNRRNICWIKLTGRIVETTDRLFPEMMGTIEDISMQKAAERKKDDFIAFLNHEIRNPLSTVKLYVQMIGKIAGFKNQSELVDLCGKANEQVEAMTTLATTFLDMSAMETGVMTLDRQRFCLETFLKSYKAELDMLYSGYRFILLTDPAVYVMADQAKLVQVLNNLISNAMKYSPKNGLISVSYKTCGNEVCISVEDQGRGIKKDGQEMLFSRYYRTTEEDLTKIKGYGIGLYLVKKIVELHCGKVGVVSRKNKGSRFYFTLPVHQKVN